MACSASSSELGAQGNVPLAPLEAYDPGLVQFHPITFHPIPTFRACDLGSKGTVPQVGAAEGRARLGGQLTCRFSPTPHPHLDVVLVGKPEILQQLDPSPKCCYLPGSHIGAAMCTGAPLSLFSTLVSFTGFLNFCYRIHSDGGAGPCDNLSLTACPSWTPPGPMAG